MFDGSESHLHFTSIVTVGAVATLPNVLIGREELASWGHCQAIVHALHAVLVLRTEILLLLVEC